jgi:hypothetical protein
VNEQLLTFSGGFKMKGKTKILILLAIAVVMVGGFYLSPTGAEQPKGYPSLGAVATGTPELTITKPGVSGPQKGLNLPTASLGAYGLTTAAVKPARIEGYQPPHHAIPPGALRQEGGETCALATAISSLPHTATGYTCDNVDDYEEMDGVGCPYSSTSPDVVYSYTPGADEVIDIDMLGSSYDTKIWVYEDNCVTGNLIACNDDYYPDYVSAIFGLGISVGHTYYIVVDGYGGGCGDYLITVSIHVDCDVVCPTGGIPEGETPCADEYVDNYNGGCNSNPVILQNIDCNTTICGTSGTYLYTGLNYRDTDWFRLVITSPTTLTWKAVAEFPLQTLLFDAGTEDCVDYTMLDYRQVNPCDTATIVWDVQPGVYWLWVGPSVFDSYPCPLEFVMIVGCEIATMGACCNNFDPYDCQELTPVDCAALPDHTFKGLGTNCGPPNPCLPAPPNDECTGAIAVTAPDCPSVVTVDGSTVGANIDCPGVLDWNAVWYSFTLPYAVNKLTIDFCPTVTPIYQAGIVLYNSCPADCPNYILTTGYQWVTCPNSNTGIQMWWSGLPAGTYYLPVAVWDYNMNPFMDFTFTACVEQAQAPANDNCANATPVGDVTNLAFSTEGATFDGPGYCQYAPNIWYCYTATCDGNAYVSVCGSSYDTKIAAYDGCVCDPIGTMLACNDDACGGYLQSEISFPVVMGQSYLIEVGGYASNTGSGIMSISCSLPLPNDECTGAPIINTFPQTVSGSTVGAGIDCPGVLDWNAVWYRFDLPYDCNNVDVNFCATNNAINTVGIVLYNSCPPDCPNYILSTGYNWLACPNGYSNPEVYWNNLPAGSYWFPVYLGVGMDFTFDVTVEECTPCDVVCPPGAMPEGEPTCTDDWDDTYNGGCNSSPYVFQTIPCNTTICGTSGTYLYYGSQYRDTDWFRVEVSEGTLTWKVVAEFPVLIFLIDAGTENCSDYTILNSITANPCDTAVLSQYVPAGVYWLWAGPSVFTGYPCGLEYVGIVECTGLGPQIVVTPTSFNQTLEPGQTADASMLIRNVGSEDLDYEIDYNLANTWLGVSPRFGTIPPTGTETVNIHFDATAVGVGSYDDVLLVTSNSTKQLDDTVEVPVHLEVAYPPDIDVPSQLSVGVLPGCTVEKPLKVSNDGLGPLNFEAHVSGNPPLKVGISQRPYQENTSHSGPLLAGKAAADIDQGNPARLSLGNPATPGTPLATKGDTLFNQQPKPPDDPAWSFGTSDAGAGYKVYENVWGITEDLTGIQWWGLALIYNAGWSNGTPENLVFNITFYSDPINDPTMPPTEVVCTYTNVVPTVVHTGLYFAGIYEEILFSWDLGTSCNLPSGYGWVAIQSQSAGQGYDWFLWASALTGDGYSYQEGSGDYYYDDALILVGGSGCPFTVAPSSGTVAGGGSTELVLTFDGSIFTQCDDETLGCYVVITSNDPDEPVVSTKVDFWSGRGDVFQPNCVIDIGDVVFLINYILKNGPAPSPLCMGDCDPTHDGVVDIADLVYLSQFLFEKGAPPEVTPATHGQPIQR